MKIVIASDNKYKAQELKDILEAGKISTILQSELKVTSVPETGLSFVENAIIKARNCCEQTNMSAVADDSGLEVEALSNRPGIYSARFAGESASDADNVKKLLLELKDVPKEKRTARFQCVMVFLRNAEDPSPIICQGTWQGGIAFEPAGKKRFGYDPVFWVSEHNCTAAKLLPEVKNKISHRAIAVQKLVIALKEELNL